MTRIVRADWRRAARLATDPTTLVVSIEATARPVRHASAGSVTARPRGEAIPMAPRPRENVTARPRGEAIPMAPRPRENVTARPRGEAIPMAPRPRENVTARIAISVRDEALAGRLIHTMTRTLRTAFERPPPKLSVLRVRSRRGAERLGPRAEGAIVVVPITQKNLRHAFVIVDRLRAAGAAGVQIVWDGSDPAREVAEPPLFAILEHVRATPGAPPVVLAGGEEPVEALGILILHRR